MKKYFILALLLAIVSMSCGKKKVFQSWIQTYNMNPVYNGTHRTDMTATYYLHESESDLLLEVNLQNVESNLAEDYLISLHASAPGTALGFEKQNTYNIGKTSRINSGAICILVSSQEFETVRNFDGYLVIQDPSQLGTDSLPQLLVAQKL